jgi:hypothetical protein
MNTALPALKIRLGQLREQIAKLTQNIERRDQESTEMHNPGVVLEKLIQAVQQKQRVHPSAQKLVKDFQRRRQAAEGWALERRPHEVAELESVKAEHTSVEKELLRLEDVEARRIQANRTVVEAERARAERFLDKQIELERLRRGILAAAGSREDAIAPQPLTGADSSKVRAQQVGIVLAELNRIAPLMLSESDYEALSQQFAGTVVFRVCNDHKELRPKLESIREHQQYVRFAHEIVAAKYGRKRSTVEKDWKTHKPKRKIRKKKQSRVLKKRAKRKGR